MRKCKKCKKTKKEKDFYPRNKSVCKKCINKRTRIWMKNNPQRTKEHSIKRIAKKGADPDYKKRQAEFYRKWYAECGRKRAKNYSEISSLWKKLNPETCGISRLIQLALKSGKIKKPKICEICKEERKLLAHHEDYNYPFKINWICYSCHKKLHNNKNAVRS